MIACGGPATWGIGRNGPCWTAEPALFMDGFAAIAQVQVRGVGRQKVGVYSLISTRSMK